MANDKKKSSEKKSNIYCGAEDLPKGKKLGHLSQCIDKGQIRLYDVIELLTHDMYIEEMLYNEYKAKFLKFKHTIELGTLYFELYQKHYVNMKELKNKINYFKKLKEKEMIALEEIKNKKIKDVKKKFA